MIRSNKKIRNIVETKIKDPLASLNEHEYYSVHLYELIARGCREIFETYANDSSVGDKVHCAYL